MKITIDVPRNELINLLSYGFHLTQKGYTPKGAVIRIIKKRIENMSRFTAPIPSGEMLKIIDEMEKENE